MSVHTKSMLHVADTISTLAVLGVLANLLPAVAALGACIWYGVQIYESKTVQAWVAKLRNKAPPTTVTATFTVQEGSKVGDAKTKME